MISAALDPAVIGPGPKPYRRLRVGLARNRGLILAIGVFAVLLGIIAFVSAAPLAYYDLQQMATNGATLAIAATGQTLVIISGGFDLSAGAVVSLVNVVLARFMPDVPLPVPVWIAIGIGIGCLSGVFTASSSPCCGCSRSWSRSPRCSSCRG